MSAVLFPLGTRIYLPDVELFGDVQRTSVLGTNGIVVNCDDEVTRMFCGKEFLKKVFDKASGKNATGEAIEIPPDVKIIGPSVLKSIGVDDSSQALLLHKFMALEKSDRLEKAIYWEEHKDDQEAMSTFLPDLLRVLEDDTQFITENSKKLLTHVDETIRQEMLEKLMTDFSHEEREKMMEKFIVGKGDHKQCRQFLQYMYEILLSNDKYIMLEFTQALVKLKMFKDETVPLITTMLERTDEATQMEIATKWRSRKLYNSNRGPRFALQTIEKYNTSDAKSN